MNPKSSLKHRSTARPLGALPAPGAVTIRDIARRAGVSIATVSRVMNKSNHPMSAEVQKKVEAALSHYDYAANIYGRGLAGRSNLIGLCIGAPLGVDPGFAMSVARIIDGIKGIARERGYHVFLEVDDREPKVDSRYPLFAGVPLAGVVVVAPRHGNLMIPFLAKRGIPFIIIGSREFDAYDYVDADNVFAGRKAVEHLADLGRKRMGFLAGPEDFAPSMDMTKGFLEEMKARGLAARPEWFARPELTVEGGRVATAEMLSLPEPPDAIFAFTDFLAMGALQAAQEIGVAVPADLSIIGYDDFVVPAAVHPQLTTFRHPDNEMAAHAMHWLIDRVSAPPRRTPSCQSVFKPQLVIRESCGGAEFGREKTQASERRNGGAVSGHPLPQQENRPTPYPNYRRPRGSFSHRKTRTS